MACDEVLKTMWLRKKLAPCGKKVAKRRKTELGLCRTFNRVVKKVEPSKKTMRMLNIANR